MNTLVDESTSLDMFSDTKDSTKAQKKIAESTAIKLLPKLIEGFQWSQKEKVAESGEEIAAVLDVSYPVIAKKIRNATASNLRPLHVAPPMNLVAIENTRHGLEDVILPNTLEKECREIIVEHHKRDDLAAYGLDPRHKVLLHGAPGNGKTMLAEAMAHEMGVPFLRIKYSGLIESYMGSTGKNIESIMEYARTAPCVLFLDEFDGVGMDRNSANNDVGEMRRITNQLLISLERLPSTCMFIAATNSLNLVDAALKRRFDFVLEVPAPSKDLIERCAKKELSPTLTPGRDISNLSNQVASLPLNNLYEVVTLCRRVRRDFVLNDGVGVEFLLQPSNL